jgi:hypothetical protein
MGQYFKAVSIDSEKSLHPHDFDNGLKLMEHSWVGNDYVQCVEYLISVFWDWFGQRLVWAWDYADNIEGEETNFYLRMSNIETSVSSDEQPSETFRYLINRTKKEFVDKNWWVVSSWCGWKIHPLPLLCCESNGRWWGDFRWDDPNCLVGSWCWDVIVAANLLTDTTGYKELNFDLHE